MSETGDDNGIVRVDTLRKMVYASLMAALTAAGAYVALPVGPVPIVLQNLFVYLAGLLLGWRWGAAAIGVYLLAGACGLPVFAGGVGGIGRFVGPTGGYLIGFLPAAAVVGWLAEWGNRRVVFDVIGMIAATAVIYSFGIAWLMTLTGMSLAKTMAVGMYPFLIGDGLKIAAAVPLAKALRPIVSGEVDGRG
jgi:biotin transport system substrate-specific component